MSKDNRQRLTLAAPAEGRQLHTESIRSDLLVCGGGLSGVCAAITAARAGLSVTLVQDRPVLGGNSSSEVRLWTLGATSHMGNNNRWSREGGLIDEILVENLRRNKEGNALIWDTILLEKVAEEPGIRLLLNTCVHSASKESGDSDRIAGVEAFCSQNSSRYELTADNYMDATGDGILGFLSGAAFRMGAESREEFGEGFAPDEDYGYLLGHSIYFMTKDIGREVSYTPPSFALKDIEGIIPRYRDISSGNQACNYWWIEYGGRLDTIAQSETIKWELWKIVYGVWDYVKNSGKFPEAKNLTLEWVGHVPGKRESRRFEGEVMLTQQDIVEQRSFEDAISFGGWSLDLHPADGVYAQRPGCDQWHSKGVYQIPYRALYSRNIKNLFLGGRTISASHVAFGSTRVMLTCAHNGAAVGMAAAMCSEQGCDPRELLDAEQLQTLRTRLQRTGHYIPRHSLQDEADLAAAATLRCSSELEWTGFDPGGPDLPLSKARALLFPCPAGPVPQLTFDYKAAADTEITVELLASGREGNFTPDLVLEKQSIALQSTDGESDRSQTVSFEAANPKDQYLFFCLRANSEVTLRGSEQRITGILTLQNGVNKKVARDALQNPPAELGIESFELWTPERRPEGHNPAIRLDRGLPVFAGAQLRNGLERPTTGSNAWVARRDDPSPGLVLEWEEPQQIGYVTLAFDADYDHAMESAIQGHPEDRVPFVVRKFTLLDGDGNVLHEAEDRHQSYAHIELPTPIRTRSLEIRLEHPSAEVPAALFAVRCYAKKP